MRLGMPFLAPRSDTCQTDYMPCLSASPLRWHAEAMTTQRSISGIYLTDRMANSHWRMRVEMVGQPGGRSSVEAQTRQNTHS